MKPRIFVSSTYYDLKYIRHNLKFFIESYEFDPVLFESGDITFTHGKELDVCCYEEVKNCHMMILIIGGRYGSEASEVTGEFIKRYQEQYVSITRKEFLTAVKKNIPIYIFIDKDVKSEFETFRKNKELFYSLANGKSKKKIIKFAHVDSVNVFEFIGDIYSRGIAVYSFEKIDDIEIQLRKQWAGLFYDYLSNLQNGQKEKVMSSTIDELKGLTNRISEVLQKVGEKIFEDDKEKLDLIIKQQDKKLIKYLASKVSDAFLFYGGHMEYKNWRNVAQYILKYYLENEILREVYAHSSDEFNQLREGVFKHISNLVNSFGTTLSKIEYQVVESLFSGTGNIIIENEEYKNEFVNELALELEHDCLPF